jgi:hypothetical protein
LSLTQIRISEISIKFSIFYTQYDIFQEKNFIPQRGHFSNFLDTKSSIKEETNGKIENAFSKIFLESFSDPKPHDA